MLVMLRSQSFSQTGAGRLTPSTSFGEPHTPNPSGVAWMADSEHKDCVICERKFSLTVRRHHCRTCGSLICGNCSKHRNSTTKQRQCDNCWNSTSRQPSPSPSLHSEHSSPPTPTSMNLAPTPTSAAAQQRKRGNSNSIAPAATSKSFSSQPSPSPTASSSTTSASTQPAEEVEWQKDKSSAECVLCFRAFTLLLRRHHCRRCGALVCSKCSSHRLPITAGTKPSLISTISLKSDTMRVCDTCYVSHGTEAAGPMNENNGVVSENGAVNIEKLEEVRLNSILADPNLTVPTLPYFAWAFTGTPGAGEYVPVGRLYVRVLNAVNLPAMNRILSTADPFCTLHVAGQSHKTRIVTGSLNPRFDQEFYFDILSAKDDELILIIWDWDQLGKNREIAYLTIPLSELAHAHRSTRWYEISNLSEIARKAGNLKEMDQQALKNDLKRRDRQLLEESGVQKEDATIRVARPRVQLELQFVYSEAGSLFSHIIPTSETAAQKQAAHRAQLLPAEVFNPVQPFDVDVLYSDLFRLLSLLSPVTNFLVGIGPILFWTKPHRSFVVLCLFILICMYPFLFLVLIELVSLRKLAHNYTYRVRQEMKQKSADLARVRAEHEEATRIEAKKKSNALYRFGHGFTNFLTGEDDDATAAFNKSAPSILTRLNPLSKEVQPMDTKDRLHLNGLVSNMLTSTLTTIGMKGSLNYYQSMLTNYADLLERLYGLCDWHDRALTKYVTIGVGILLVYSLFLPQSYLIMLAGVYVLTMFTPPSRFVLAVIFGIMQYRVVRASRMMPPPTQQQTTNFQQANSRTA